MAKKKKTAEDKTLTVVCCITNKTLPVAPKQDGEPTLPKGWKRFAGKLYSPEGFKQSFTRRSMNISVDRVLWRKDKPTNPGKDASKKEKTAYDAACGDVAQFNSASWDDKQATAESWREFKRCLNISWRHTAQVGNWLLRNLAAQDQAIPVRNKDKFDLPELDVDVDALQRRARALFKSADNGLSPTGADVDGKEGIDSQSMYSVCRTAISKYKRERGAMLVSCRISLPSFRHGEIPLPIESKDSTFTLEPVDPDHPDDMRNAFVVFRLRIAGSVFLVRLKNDPKRFARQLEPLRRVAAGELPRGAISVRSKDNTVIIGTEVSLPRQNCLRDQEEPFLVRTDPAALLVGSMWGRQEYVLNEDELRRWHASHQCYLQRMSQDRKAESRAVKHWRHSQPPIVGDPSGHEPTDSRLRGKKRYHHRRNMQNALDARCQKHHNRVQDRLHKISAIVVNHAVRRRVGLVIYDDTIRTYMGSFAYARLRTLIKEKLDAVGIDMRLVNESPEGEEETPVNT